MAEYAVGVLSREEREVVRGAASGVVAGPPPGIAPWRVRAELVRWLCGGRASRHVDARGIRLLRVSVVGTLDLSSMTVSIPLELRECELESLLIARATLAAVVLDGSTMQVIGGEGVRVADDFTCRQSTVRAGVRMVNADLGGDLVLTGARVAAFEGDERYLAERVAVDLNGASVSGSVFIDQGFHSEGEVRLRGITLGEGIEANETEIVNAGGHALGADRVRAGGSVRLERARVTGEIHMPLGRIQGEVRAASAQVRNPHIAGENGGNPSGGGALNLNSTEIAGDVWLDRDFVAEGYIRMVATTVGGNLYCTGSFTGDVRAEVKAEAGSDRFALNGNRLTVRGHAFLEGASFTGGVSLIGARVSGELSFAGTKLKLGARPKGEPWVLLAERLSVGGTVQFCANPADEKKTFTSEGLLDLRLAHVGANLRFVGVAFTDGGRSGVQADHLVVERKLEWVRVTGPGDVSLNHASVAHLDDEFGSWATLRRLSLDGFNYSSVCMEEKRGWPQGWRKRVEWLRKAAHVQPRMYDQLSSTLRSSGLEDDARHVQIEKGKAARQKETSWLGWLRRLVLEWVLGHGYQPSRAIWWSLAMILLGWFVYTRGAQEGLITPEKGRLPAPADVLSRASPPGDSIAARVPSFSPLAYSVDVFLPIVNLHQEDYWHPNAHLRCRSGLRPMFPNVTCGRLLRYYHWVHILVGWVLTTLAVAGFTGLVRRL